MDRRPDAEAVARAAAACARCVVASLTCSASRVPADPAALFVRLSQPLFRDPDTFLLVERALRKNLRTKRQPHHTARARQQKGAKACGLVELSARRQRGEKSSEGSSVGSRLSSCSAPGNARRNRGRFKTKTPTVGLQRASAADLKFLRALVR